MNLRPKAEPKKQEDIESSSAAIFYMVGSPIGNRDDITTRAMQVLGDVDFIVAEDTRHTGQLLSFYGIKKPLISFRDAPTPVMNRSLAGIKERLAKGERGAYVTDAGTPSVSDPGWRLVQSILSTNTTLIPIPGPSAVTTLLCVVDIPLEEYRFMGFLPKKKGYQTKLDDIVTYLSHKEPHGVVVFESPNRVRTLLTDLMKREKTLRVIIGRELTKKFETIYRNQLTEEFIRTLPEKGEYVILIHPSRSIVA